MKNMIKSLIAAIGVALMITGSAFAADAAKIGEQTYETLEAAVTAAQAGDEIVLLADVTLDAELTLPAGIKFNGNGKTVAGTIKAGGNLEFVGNTIVSTFNPGWYNNVITIGAGASLKATSGRMTVSYGNTFNITGSIADGAAKTADKTTITPSLELVGGISFNGNGGGVNFNVLNAYVKLGDSTTKNSGATGEFNLNFTNSIVDFTKTLKTYMPTVTGLAPAFKLNAVGSVIDFASHLEFWLDNTTVALDATKLTVGGSFANAGTLALNNNSEFIVKAPIMSSHGGNTGTIAVNSGTFELVDSNEAWQNAGTMTVGATGTLKLNDFKCVNEGVVSVDVTGMNVGTSIADRIVLNSANTDFVYSNIKTTGSDLLVVDDEGKLAERPLVGSGTEADPFVIASLADLELFRAKVNGGNSFAGKFVKMTADINLGNAEWTPIAKFNGTFDGDNHKISNLRVVGNGNVGFFKQVADQTEHVSGTVKNVTFENATIISESGEGNAGLIALAPMGARITNVRLTGNVNIQGYRGVGGIVGSGFPVMTDCSVEAEGTIHATYWGVGGILGFANDKGAKVYNATVKGVGNGLTISSYLGGVGGVTGTPYGAATTGATVSNVTISSSNNYYMAYVDAGGAVSGTVVVEDVVVKVNGEAIIGNDAVAAIGGVGYFSLQSAIEAVQNGETVALLADVDVTTPAYGQNALNHARKVSFTLDLNGKTLTANTGNSVFRFNIANSGATSDVAITIKNGKVVAGTSTWCALMAAGISADVKAVMNLEDLTVEASKAGDLAIKAWDYALINATNVTVNATNGAGGFYAVGGEIVLDDCTVTQKGLHTAPYMSMAFAVSTKGKMTVNSGTYSAEPTAATEGYNQGSTHGSWVGGVMNSGGTLIINGGTFSNGNFGEDSLATYARGLIFGDTASNIRINGGTFNALKSVIDYQNNLGVQPNPNIVIAGGTFSANPTVVTSYGGVEIAEGYIVTENNGTYTVAKPVAAKIGETTYATLADAFAEAKDGDTITLLGDCGITTGIILNKNITIDGGNFTLTAVSGDPSLHQMVKIESEATIKNITLAVNHKYDYGIRMDDSASDLTLENVTILYAGKAEGHKGGEFLFGASVFLQQGNLLVKGKFTAFSGGETAGTFPFTGILYWPAGDTPPTFSFADGATASISDPTGATSDSDLLLVGAPGILPVEQADEMLSAFNIPAGFAPYTLKLDCPIVQSIGGFTGASSLAWNTIIDYGKKILTVVKESTTETQVEVGILDDVEIPEVFVYEDANFSINGNGKVLSGTIDFTDNVGTISNVVLTSDMTFVMTNVTEGCVKLGEAVTITEPVKVIPPDHFGRGEESATLIEFAEGSGLSLEDFEIDTSTVQLPEGSQIVQDGNKIIVKLPIAQVGNRKFATLAEAFEAANDGDTVRVLYSFNTNETIVINKAITFDFSGDVITSTASGAAIQVAAAGVKIIGGELVASGNGIEVTNGGSAVIERGVYEVTGDALDGAVTVSGGTFNKPANVINAFKSDDCEAVDNGDGWCTVMDYVAQFGDAKYVSLQDAIDAAAATNPTVDNPATVTLLGNVAGLVTLPDNVIISANGYTVENVVDDAGDIVELHGGAYQSGVNPPVPSVRSIKIEGDTVKLAFVPRQDLTSVVVETSSDLKTWTAMNGVTWEDEGPGRECVISVAKPEGSSAFFRVKFEYAE